MSAKPTEVRDSATYYAAQAKMPDAPPGYKQTEVGVIPEDWDTVPLKEITSLMTNGFVGKATTHYTDADNGVTYIQGFNVIENGFNFTGIKKVTPEFHRQNKKSSLKEGDLLTVQTGDAGLTTIVSKELAGANCHALVISRFFIQKAYPLFFAHYFNSSFGRQRLKDLETGTTMKHLNVGDLLQWAVPLPQNIKEQRAIAAALSDVDALITALDKLITKKCAIKTAAMQQLLTGKQRLPGFSGKWEVKRLGDVAHIQRGASPRPIDSPIWFDNNSSVGWVRISDVTRSGMYLRETTQRLSPLGIQQSRPVNCGSLIMSICATVGRPIITEIDVCIHDGFVVFDNLNADKYFIYYFLKSIEADWTKHGQTGSQMNLNTGLINRTGISLPTKEEQTAIAALLSDMDAEIAALEVRRDKTRAIKQGMMQELLTGKTRLI
jgi:type I restriction enzyme S subunit